MQRSVKDVFDLDMFIHDCHEYRRRHKMNVTQFARHADIEPSHLMRILKKEWVLSLVSACKLAMTCDLDLNAYMYWSEDAPSTAAARNPTYARA